MSIVARFLNRHRRQYEAALSWDEHWASINDIFTDDDEPEPWFTLGDALFLDEHGIEAT